MQCNPKNKRLVKINKECDKYFENKYTHGGYECGDDGKWSSKCIPSYCDIGYMFDPENSKCIIDYCSIIIEIIENNNIFLLITIISLIISFLILVVVVIVIIVYKNKYKNDSDYSEITKISLSVQDRDELN